MVEIAAGAAEGVAYLHAFPSPIIHRDIKPHNILVDENFQVASLPTICSTVSKNRIVTIP